MVLLIVKMDEFICKLNNIEIFISWAEVPTKWRKFSDQIARSLQDEKQMPIMEI